MAQLILSNGLPRRNFSKTILQSFVLTPYFLVFSLIISVVLVTVVTLMFSTTQVTKGYVLSQLENEHNKLLLNGQKYDMDIFKVRSLDYISKSDRVSVMVKPSNVAFVRGDNTIASR